MSLDGCLLLVGHFEIYSPNREFFFYCVLNGRRSCNIRVEMYYKIVVRAFFE